MIRAGLQPTPPRLPSLADQILSLAGYVAAKNEEAMLLSRKGGANLPFEKTLTGHVYKAMVPGVRYDVAGLAALLPQGARPKAASYIAYELSRKNRVFKRGTPGAFTYERPMPGASA